MGTAAPALRAISLSKAYGKRLAFALAFAVIAVVRTVRPDVLE